MSICNKNEMVKVDEINYCVQSSILSISPDSIEELYIRSSYLVWNFPSNLSNTFNILHYIIVLHKACLNLLKSGLCPLMKILYKNSILNTQIFKLIHVLFILHCSLKSKTFIFYSPNGL